MFNFENVIYYAGVLSSWVYCASNMLLALFSLLMNLALNLFAFVCWFHRLFDLFVKT
jgi:hypothetical protein